MKTTEVAFKFPLMGFTPDKEFWGFPDLDTLTSCGPKTLKENSEIGMELIDADLRRWIVRSVRRIGRAEPLLKWLVMSVLTATPQSRIEQELEEVEPISLSELKERTCTTVLAFPGDFGAEGPQDEIVESLLEQVRKAHTLEEIYGLFGLDSFKAY